jgi:V8-like Glu-specific endopeptidase
MNNSRHRRLRERFGPAGAALVTVAAIAATALVSANLGGGTAAPSAKKPAVAAAPDGVVSERNKKSPAETKSYWTVKRMQSARELVVTRTGVQGDAYGDAGLDFTRSRIAPKTANIATPYRTTGKMFFTIPGQGNFVCSASTIDDRVVLTAAHCLYTPAAGPDPGFHTNITFVPGYDGTRTSLAKQRPFGTWASTQSVIPQNWVDTEGSLPSKTDYGVFVVADQSISGSVKKLAAVSGQYRTVTNHLSDTHVTMLGYPCNLDDCNVMQRNDSSDHRLPPGFGDAQNAYEYGSDMEGGSSGGPWIENFGTGDPISGTNTSRNRVVAVTSYGYINGLPKVQGASELDSTFNAVKNFACNATAGNC